VGVPDGHLHTLASDLGIEDTDPALVASITHSSYAAEHHVESNERLEFLGDAVVGLVIAERAFRELDLPEGGLAQVRQATVSAPSLAAASRAMRLDEALRLGRGEEASGGRGRDSLLADTYEAVVAAVYLHDGLEAARALVRRTLDERFMAEASDPGASDAKSRLQEWAEQLGLGAPRYEVTGDGPGHERRYSATVRIGGEVAGTGEGSSKKVAELAAARAAWEHRDA
jgi:ribonuclease III